jgi:hypothetical protein
MKHSLTLKKGLSINYVSTKGVSTKVYNMHTRGGVGCHLCVCTHPDYHYLIKTESPQKRLICMIHTLPQIFESAIDSPK